MNAFHQTALNFTGQNVGAHSPKRVKKVLYLCMLCAGSIGLILGVATYIFGKPLLSIYITDSAEAIQAGVVRLFYIALFYAVCGVMEALTGTIRGMGASISPMAVSVFGACFFRIAWIFTVFQIDEFHKPAILYLSYIISWILIIVGLTVVFSVIYKKFKKSNKQKELSVEKQT